MSGPDTPSYHVGNSIPRYGHLSPAAKVSSRASSRGGAYQHALFHKSPVDVRHSLIFMKSYKLFLARGAYDGSFGAVDGHSQPWKHTLRHFDLLSLVIAVA